MFGGNGKLNGRAERATKRPKVFGCHVVERGRDDAAVRDLLFSICELHDDGLWLKGRASPACVEIKFYGAFVLNRRVYLHAIDAKERPLDGVASPADTRLISRRR